MGFFQRVCGNVKEPQENRELEEMKAELLKRSHELVETQRSLRKLQEADASPGGHGMEVRMDGGHGEKIGGIGDVNV